MVGQVAAVVGALALVRVLTERLEPAQYGQLTLGLTLAGLVNQSVLGGVSAGIARLYSIAAERQELPAYLRDAVRLLGCATIAVVGLGALTLVALKLAEQVQWMGLAAAALGYSLLSGFNGALSGIQNAARQRAIVAFHGGLDAWLRIVLAIGALWWLGTSSTAVVIGYCTACLLVTASQIHFLRNSGVVHGPVNGEGGSFLLQMWSFSWPFSAWGVFAWMQQASDRWALASYASQDSVGMYAVLSQLGYAPISMITTMVMAFLAPILYQRAGDATDPARNAFNHRLVWRITLGSLTIALGTSTAAFFLHGWLFSLLVAAEYRAISNLLPWMVLAGGVFATGQILALKLLSEMKTARMAVAKITTSLMGVGLNVYGAKVAGLSGVVAALLAFAVLYLVWMICLSCSVPTAAGQPHRAAQEP